MTGMMVTIDRRAFNGFPIPVRPPPAVRRLPCEADAAANASNRGRPREGHGFVDELLQDFFPSAESVNSADLLSFSAHNFTLRSRSALPMTETEEKLMASEAIMGERSRPKNG